MARATLVLDHQGSATYADNVELLVGDGASLDVISLQDWNDDAVHLSTTTRAGPGRAISHTVVSFGGDVVRIVPSVSYAGRGGDAELNGLYFADAGQHWSTGCSSTTRRRMPQPRAVQGRAAGRRRAQRLDRRRADRRGGERHGHLRVQPEPGADRRGARRLGAEPGDSHR